MKPKRPSETDLLAVVQNGFQEQLQLDREPHIPPVHHGRPSLPEARPSTAAPAAQVRITLTIPEGLRYRIKLAVMDQRRSSHPRLTQDEFCAEALQFHLEKRERDKEAGEILSKVRTFLKACIQTRGLKRPLAGEAEALVVVIDKAMEQSC